MMAKVLLSGIVWGFVLYSIYRGYRGAAKIDRYVVTTWTIFIAVAVVFTLRIREIYPAIDRHFVGYPVAFLLNVLGALVATTAYALSLIWLMERSPQIYRRRWYHTALLYSAPLIASLQVGSLSLIWFGATTTQVQYVMEWLIEGYGVLQAIFLFVPVNLAMFRQEQVFPMRVKHLAMLVFCTTSAVTGTISVSIIPGAIITGDVIDKAYLAPRGLITACCLLIVLTPHRWLTLLLLPPRWYRYVRLAALEHRIERMVSIRREVPDWQRVLDSEQMEMAIYVTVINILDHYPRVDRGDPLVAQIETLLPNCAGYDDLVEGLCHIRL